MTSKSSQRSAEEQADAQTSFLDKMMGMMAECPCCSQMMKKTMGGDAAKADADDEETPGRADA
jgi:hypothetical protein